MGASCDDWSVTGNVRNPPIAAFARLERMIRVLKLVGGLLLMLAAGLPWLALSWIAIRQLINNASCSEHCMTAGAMALAVAAPGIALATLASSAVRFARREEAIGWFLLITVSSLSLVVLPISWAVITGGV